MKKETKEFVEEGMKRYKQASMVMVSFGKVVETMLQNILKKQKDWGQFKPNKKSKAVKSTKYWSEYPLLNARIQGTLREKPLTIGFDMNWYQSEVDYPFYSVWIYPFDIYSANYMDFAWNNSFEAHENRLRYYPDPNNFNPEMDFKKLLDELVRFLKYVDSQKDADN